MNLRKPSQRRCTRPFRGLLLLFRVRARGERLHLRLEVLFVARAQELRLLRREIRVRRLVLREVQLLTARKDMVDTTSLYISDVVCVYTNIWINCCNTFTFVNGSL